MRNAPITFERQALYEEVWAAPMTKVSAKYGFSDNGLRKVCQSMDIPLPPRGYWAKIAAGHKLGRMPLPDPDRGMTVVAEPHPQPARRAFQTDEDDEWLARRLEQEASEPPIVVDPQPRRWHSGLLPLKQRLEAASAESEKALREYEREEARRQKNPRLAHQPHPAALAYHFARSSGGVLLNTHKASALRVTSGTYKSALALLNAIFYAADRRGVAPEHDEKEGRFALKVDGAHFHFAIRERMEDAWCDRVNSWTKKVEKEKYTSPTGRLFIASYRNGWDARQHMADADGNFGDLSKILFQPAYHRVVEFRELQRQEADRRRRQELHRQELAAIEKSRAEEEAARKERERLTAIEQSQEVALVSEARDWETAALLRRYLEARRTSGAASSEEWLTWADAVANRLDPLAKPR